MAGGVGSIGSFLPETALRVIELEFWRYTRQNDLNISFERA